MFVGEVTWGEEREREREREGERERERSVSIVPFLRARASP